MKLAASDLFSLQGRTVLLTGASGYLGRTMVRGLLMNGARVIALGRSDRLQASVRQWRDEFGESSIEAHQIDMYDLAVFARILDEAAASEARIDVLINNAHELGPGTGFNVPEGALEQFNLEVWQRNLTGGVIWPALAVQKMGAKMKEAGSGSIINISTMYALVAPSPALYEGTDFLNPPGYSASKAALLAFTRYVASFWGPFGIRANAILPGPFSNVEDTGPNAVRSDDFFLARLKARTCVGRIGKPAELIGPLLYLASDASSYMTGQALSIDGGWTVT